MQKYISSFVGRPRALKTASPKIPRGAPPVFSPKKRKSNKKKKQYVNQNIANALF